MHWVASLGTHFQLTRLNAAGEDSSNITTVIVVACLSVAASFVMAGFAVYNAHIRKGYANKAQRITLAAAVFDRQGRILVTVDGHLPSEEITSTFLQKVSKACPCYWIHALTHHRHEMMSSQPHTPYSTGSSRLPATGQASPTW